MAWVAGHPFGQGKTTKVLKDSFFLKGPARLAVPGLAEALAAFNSRNSASSSDAAGASVSASSTGGAAAGASVSASSTGGAAAGASVSASSAGGAASTLRANAPSWVPAAVEHEMAVAAAEMEEFDMMIEATYDGEDDEDAEAYAYILSHNPVLARADDEDDDE